MPIVHEIKRKHSHIIIWDIEETKEELLDMLKLSDEKIRKFEQLTNNRQQEFLGIRACFQYLKIKGEVLYEPSGKPYIKSNHHISISHSWGKVAFAISKFAIGVDIEKNRPEKTLTIKDKFVRPDEWVFIEKNKISEYLHTIWGMKEALYKLHNGNLWSFLNHYRVQKFKYSYDQRITCEIIDKEHHTQYYTGYYDRIKDGFYLIYVLDNVL